MRAALRICVVSPHLYPILAPEANIQFSGGAEVQQMLLAQGWRDLGYEVSAVTLDYGQPNGCYVNGIKVLKAYKPNAGIKILRFFHPRLSGIWKALRQANADVYYQRCAGILTGIVAEFCLYHRKKFVFAGAHNNDFMAGNHYLEFWISKFIYEWGLRKANRVLVQNECQKKCLKENFGMEGVLVPNIGRESDYCAQSHGGKVGWIGVIRPWKAPLRFVEIARKNKNLRCLLIGGPSTNRIDQRLWNKVCEEAKGLSNLVLTGPLPSLEVSKRLKTISVLVNTSVQEGFPNTFLEAWARGIPTVSFVNVDGGNGRPTPGIVVQDLAEMGVQVHRLMTDETLWKKESQRCREMFNQYFRFFHVAADYKELFNRLISDSREPEGSFS